MSPGMFSQYQLDGLFDEMFERPDAVRPHYAAVHKRLQMAENSLIRAQFES